MLARLYSIVALISVAVVLAGGGFVGYLYGSGRLNGERTERIAAVLRGEEQPVEAEAVLESTDPPSTKARSADEIRQSRERQQLQLALIERAKADADARRALVDQALQNLINEQEQFERRRKSWSQQRERIDQAAQDEGFQRELRYVAKLSPKLAKEHIVRTWNKHQADAVRLFMELNTSKGQRILEQFKTPEELQIAHELLEQLRLQTTDSEDQSGRTAGLSP